MSRKANLCPSATALEHCCWPHDNTAPKQLMTAAEMLQAQADIQTDARARLQEIRDEIALLEAEMADLEEVIDG